MKWFFLACSGLRVSTMDHSFIWLPSVTRNKVLDPSLKKVIKYFVVSLDIKFRCNVMYVCFRGRQFFKVPFGKLISRVFYPNSLATPLIFPLASIWRLKAASNLEAAKSTLLYKSCSNQKIIMDLLLKLLKFE